MSCQRSYQHSELACAVARKQQLRRCVVHAYLSSNFCCACHLFHKAPCCLWCALDECAAQRLIITLKAVVKGFKRERWGGAPHIIIHGRNTASSLNPSSNHTCWTWPAGPAMRSSSAPPEGLSRGCWQGLRGLLGRLGCVRVLTQAQMWCWSLLLLVLV